VTALTPRHYSTLKRRSFSPRGMTHTRIPDDIRILIESECLDIFTVMSNAGCSLHQTLTAIYLSGMSAAVEIQK
jgi:hypothetical protein